MKRDGGGEGSWGEEVNSGLKETVFGHSYRA